MSRSFPLRAVVAILGVLAVPAPALAADIGESGFVQCAAWDDDARLRILGLRPL